VQVLLLRGFQFFFKTNTRCFALVVALMTVEDVADLGTPVPLECYHHHSVSSPMRPNELWTRPHGAARACPWLSMMLVVGFFEGIEEGIGVVKAMGGLRRPRLSRGQRGGTLAIHFRFTRGGTLC